MVTADGDESGELSKLQQSYELLGELSRDERVTVYVARDRSSGKEVAIKVLRASDAPGRESLAHYASDARMLTALEHPNIIAVHAVKWLSEDVVAVVTERVRGPSLRQVLDVAGTLPVARATEVIRGLGRALAWAHSSQIMHRDMRPENVIFEDRTGRVVLSDFGLARRIETVPAAGEPDPYRAPELVDGRYPDRRSDVYSLGIVGWELLTGRRPWPDDMEPLTPGERAPDPPPLAEVRPGLPAALVAAIEGAVQLERDRRIPDVVTFMERLTGVAPPEPEVAEEEEAAQEQETSFAPTEWVALPVPRMPQRPRRPARDREVSRPVTTEPVASDAAPLPAPDPTVAATTPISAEMPVEPLVTPAPAAARTDRHSRSKKAGGKAAATTSPRADQPPAAEPAEEVRPRGSEAPRDEVSDRPSPGVAAGLVAGAAAAAAGSTAAPSPASAPTPRTDVPRAKERRDEQRVSEWSQPETSGSAAPRADVPLGDAPLPEALPADTARAERSTPDAPSRGRAVDRPVGRPVERPVERGFERPAEQSAERAQSERSTERSTGRPVERPVERARTDRPLADALRPERPSRTADTPLGFAPSNRPEAPAPRADRPSKLPFETERITDRDVTERDVTDRGVTDRDVTERWAAPLSDVELPPPEPVPFADTRAEPISGPISGPVRTPGKPPERFEPAMRGGLATPRLPAAREPKPREPKSRDKKRNSSGVPAPALQPLWDTPVEFPLPATPDPRPTPTVGVAPPPSGLRSRFTRRGVTIAAIAAAALIGAVTLARMERAPDTTGELMTPETPAGYGGDVVLERSAVDSAADSNEVRGPASATSGGAATSPRGGTGPQPSSGSASTPGAAAAPTTTTPGATRPVAPATRPTTTRGAQPAAPNRPPPSGTTTNPTRAGTSTARPPATRPTPGAERPAAAVAATPPSVADSRSTGPCGSAALADQRACLAAHIERSDANLNQTYGDVIVALRQRASSAPGDPDPPEVQRLRSVQRSWVARRDAECRRRGRGREGRLWATPRARCLEEYTAERNRELSAMLARLRRN